MLGIARRIAVTCGWCLAAAYGSVQAQPVTYEPALNSWLMRVHQAARKSVYTGTFVVTAGGNMVSARIWHVCDGSQQLERVESLSGTPRAIFRRDDQVTTFFPQSRVAITEVRDSLGLFPNLLKSSDSSIGDYYRLKALGAQRVAGMDTEVFQLVPVDRLRYGYRVWNEKKTGLIVQLQTLDLDGKVLEQAAFSELQMDAPVNANKLSLMGSTTGYRVLQPDLQKTTAEAHGWLLQKDIDGFKATACYLRPAVSAASASSGDGSSTLQWMFSDGVATVSLFLESFDGGRHVREGFKDLGGATHSLTRRVGSTWLTVVGEAPPATLNAFAQALERKK